MSSDDLLNQPPRPAPNLTDDPIQPKESMDALRAFLNNAPPPPSPPPAYGATAQATSSMAPAHLTDPSEEVQQKPATPVSLHAEIAAAEQELRELEMSPAERYRKRLKDRDIPLLEAQQILDRLIIQLQPYTERYHLAGSTYVTFRTRTQQDQDRLNAVLEDMAPKYVITIQSEEARQHIASSILAYGAQKFDHTTDEGIQVIVKWVTSLPQPVFVLLQRKLYQFDTKIDAVFQDGYMENFWPTPS